MHLTRTKPQPRLSETEDQRSWQGGDGFHPGYGESAYGQDEAVPAATAGQSGGYEDEPFPDADPQRHKRRWPIVSGVCVLLVLVVGGGLAFGWQYVRGQYYIGVQAGHVAVFRGVDQDVAGISLSSLVQSYPSLTVTQLDSDSQSQVSQTISYSSLQDAQSVIQRLQGQVTQCQQGYQTLAAWQTQNLQHQSALAKYNKLPAAQKRNARKPAPLPAEPASPPAAECAPSTAFGIPASALPGAATQGTPVSANPNATPTSSKAAPSPGKSS